MSEEELRRRLDSVTAELLSTYEEIELLTTVAEIAGTTSDVAGVGRRVLDEAAGLMEADVAFMFYSDAELRGEAPDPIGVTPEERDALAEVLHPWLQENTKPEVIAPFSQGAHVPHSPDAILVVPLRAQAVVLGSLCLGRRGEGATFSAPELKILSVLGGSAATVLLQRKNLDLVRMARGLEQRNNLLKGIMAISQEITASLNLDRLLHALSNLPTRTLGFDRCAVLVEEGGRLRLRAVSGTAKIDRADAEMKSLERLLDWVAGRGQRVLAQWEDEGAASFVADPPEAADQARPHMEAAEARALLAMPLQDDQGLLGVISFESGTSAFIDETRLEGAIILANQATVALRNARLYGDVPLIGLLAPLRGGLGRIRALPRRRVAAWTVGLVALALVLVFGRWEMRVGGRVTALPNRLIQVSAPVAGVVRHVGEWNEGDEVPPGAVLARLDVPDLLLRHNEAMSRHEAAERQAGRLEAEGDPASLRLARVEAERWRIEADHLAARLDEASLRAPIGGVLLTPRLQERAGERLDVGGIFCTLAEMNPLKVEIAVAEKDADVLLGDRDEIRAVLKFQAFPEKDFVARVSHVRSSVETIEGRTVIVAEGTLQDPGPGEGLRPGMTGEARISAGSRSLGWILFRKPWRFMQRMIWL